MDIQRSGSQPSRQGSAEYFTGTVRIDPLFQAQAPARASGAIVTFEPGARTAWHAHPLGQTLIVILGSQISNPLTFPVQIFISAEVGSLLLNGRFLDIRLSRDIGFWEQYIAPILLGSLVLGVISAVVSFVVVKGLLKQRGGSETTA